MTEGALLLFGAAVSVIALGEAYAHLPARRVAHATPRVRETRAPGRRRV